MNRNGHTPVLIKEVLDYLDVAREGLYIDCTLGLGGHALEILKRNPRASLLGFDIDEKSLLEAKKRMKPFSERISLFHSDFRYLPDIKVDFQKVKGVLLDLGLSSYQLDSPDRGFSYSLEGPLDMRMDSGTKSLLSKSSTNTQNTDWLRYSGNSAKSSMPRDLPEKLYRREKLKT